jgi:hypothetical protein
VDGFISVFQEKRHLDDFAEECSIQGMVEQIQIAGSGRVGERVSGEGQVAAGPEPVRGRAFRGRGVCLGVDCYGR